ncbi:MAG: phosphate ABC transporter substrate-binding protein [Actinomycetota bacterium]|nr:phosphate ABC transporter substrate-binding protein [Actinomycetota bacterium]
MRRKTKVRIAGAGLVMLMMTAIALGGCGGGVSGTLTLSGSTTLQPIAQEAAEQFMEKNPDANVTVQGGGSSVGITQVIEGSVNIGNSSRELKDEEQGKGLVDHKVALDVIVLIANPGVGVSTLTPDQVKGIFTGSIDNWNKVGGGDETITVVIRDSASGTREMFDEKALGQTKDKPVTMAKGAIEANSNGVMRQKVASTKGAVGYISYGYLDKSVEALDYDGVPGNLETALGGTYPLSRYLHMFTNGEATGIAKAYIDFVLSPDFQNETVAKEYIPMTKVKSQ